MPLFDLFWAMLYIFLLVVWIWVVVSILMDIFRSDDLGGFAKTLWVLFVIFLPVIGILSYLIVRGSSMQERSLREAAEREKASRQYIQEVASTSTADELEKLKGLHDRGVLTDDEFAAQKAKLLA